MAFMISKVPSLSETEKMSLNHSEERDSETLGPISMQLYLKSSAGASSKTLDKEAVLRRIRHHKSLNKVRGAFQSLVSSSGQAKTSSIQEQKWLDQEVAFFSP
ncbi:hypothetical protein I3843_01G025200 [Carya illinoinensis]|uniref:Uncharacterized protein n=1 Tax=Carya illinoinensis TaxID=32201 RepID=A0A8T1RI72_CARIL|nr:hypothetical protein I3760_01G026500 [Carya illinoinensis]KAG6666385.1 hypothetical protein CIPAW_01G028200 [Carya illinoinensis]KAG6729420.1 hypothetical protein I3842_01G029000 [Carya illinoinensis]KAG7993814.1 hypothetical protein I3843_01G025200 [Carya illinoinensis]